MDDKIDKVRKALEIADAFCGRHTADECPDTIAIPIKDALAALSAIDPDAIRRECLESIRSHFRSMTQADIVKWDGPGVLGGAMSKELFNKTLEYAILSAEPAQDDGKPEANDNEQLDLVLKIRNDCTLDEALIAMQAFILYHDAELKRRLEEAKE